MNELSSMSMYITYDNKYHVSLYLHLAGKMKSFIVKHFPSRSNQRLQCVDSKKDDIHPNFGTQKCSKKNGCEKKTMHMPQAQVILLSFVLFPPASPGTKKTVSSHFKVSTGSFGSTNIPKNCSTG